MTNNLQNYDPVKYIIDLHTAIVDSAKKTVGMVVEVGRALVEMKESLPHGQFTQWVETTLPFQIRTAQKYMRVFLNKDQVNDVEDLSSAYALLENKPQPQEKERPEYIEPTNGNGDGKVYFYEKDLLNLLSIMDRVYDKLSSHRDHTTPVAVSHFIGNIRDMADILRTWVPGNLSVCTKCNGSGVIDGIICNNCIEGYVGHFKISTR